MKYENKIGNGIQVKNPNELQERGINLEGRV
jgi:hypothetical protein